MSTQEIVLKFIKCPSCKSLMPSTAVKCGMCGFELKVVEEEPSSESVRKGRLRQRTTSFAGDLISGEQHQSSEDTLKESPVRGSEKTDVSDKKSLETSESYVSPGKIKIIDGKPVSRISGLRFRVPDEVENKVESDPDYEPEDDDSFIDEEDDSSNEIYKQEGSRIREDESDDQHFPKKRKRKRKKKKRVVAESDSVSIHDPLSSSASFDMAKSKTETSNLSRDFESISRDSVSSRSDLKFESGQKSSESGVANIDIDVPLGENATHRSTRDLSHVRQVSSEERGPSEVPIQSSVVSHDISQAKVANVSSRNVPLGDRKMDQSVNSSSLIGWFVNYSTNPKGTSFEIRQGKQFIGRQALRSDDLVISDSAVSTPHCLLQADNSESVLLQDLMSEQGTFVKKGADSEYRQIEASIALQHGDRIRLGSYELVVCLIPR
ncbi:MAG TPA: FHA domain-containing protein [Oligoflexia bacterium]|nr:FHA domain-containing protein [Oligoflexia bacterium]HMP47090.1 FHA domain-containing protein [Oligoflexia bacterium]